MCAAVEDNGAAVQDPTVAASAVVDGLAVVRYGACGGGPRHLAVLEPWTSCVPAWGVE
ncbi:hypothetical protein M2271_004166 [Streptomyces sp. LBL]|nr:hypothetical protein [Streptomyces sp. LBL]